MSKKTHRKSKTSSKTGRGPLYKAAKTYSKSKISIFPANKKDKAPLIPSWKPYQNKIAKLQEIKKWFNKATRPTCIAMVCGEVSGNVEVLDFDVKGKLKQPINVDAKNIQYTVKFGKPISESGQEGRGVGDTIHQPPTTDGDNE